MKQTEKRIPHIAAVEQVAKAFQTRLRKISLFTIGYTIRINIKVRTKMNKSGAFKNNFSELASQQNTVKLTLKMIKPDKIFNSGN